MNADDGRPAAPPRLPALAALRRALGAGRPDAAALALLRNDPRPAAAALLASAERRWAREDAALARHDAMLSLERALAERGRVTIAGVDEAGLGPLAGPVVAAAVVLGDAAGIVSIDDSKKLDEKKRLLLEPRIRERAAAFAIGMASVAEVDQWNVHQAGLLAMRRAVEGLAIRPDHVLVDARRIPGINMEQSAHIRGDSLSLSIAAASILAKVHRDHLMDELDRQYPGYGLARHKGYGTAEHQEALRRLGASPVHRLSYQAVRDLVAQGKPSLEPGPSRP